MVSKVQRPCAAGRRWAALMVLLMTIGLPLGGAAAVAVEPVLLVVGDSLSAGYGIDPERGWVERLGERLDGDGYRWTVVNASISGDTTRGGRARLPELLERWHPRLVVIELGGNDGLRGISPGEMRANLEAMIDRVQATQARVLLVGVRLPPNYGPIFIDAFAGVFRSVADSRGVPLVPRLLEGVGGESGLVQEDGIHPTAEAQPILLENVWPVLEPLLAE